MKDSEKFKKRIKMLPYFAIAYILLTKSSILLLLKFTENINWTIYWSIFTLLFIPAFSFLLISAIYSSIKEMETGNDNDN